MIISHKFQYLFIEIPLTASWAIRHELREFYGGVPILHKHAAYAEFRKIAKPEQQDYFIFAAIRNPLDCIVSSYFKLRSDHKGVFSDPDSTAKLVTDYSDIQRYQVIKGQNLDFEGYFLRYIRKPYSDMLDLSGKHLDFLIRFENLQNDFSEVLEKLQIKQVRPIPERNKTEGKGNSFVDYYTPKTIERAKRVCGSYMKKWGYEFPPEWGEHHPTSFEELQYQILKALKYLYIINFRYNNTFPARVIRQFRALFN
jgi:hypothetical protein